MYFSSIFVIREKHSCSPFRVIPYSGDSRTLYRALLVEMEDKSSVLGAFPRDYEICCYAYVSEIGEIKPFADSVWYGLDVLKEVISE